MAWDSSAAAARACGGCGSLSFSEAWYKAFGIACCYSCQQHDALVSKAKAKQLFLVTDTDLKGLGTIEKPNPHHKDWKPMRLYLRSQVMEVAYAKHGGAAGLEMQRHVFVQKKLAQERDAKSNADKKQEQLQSQVDKARKRVMQEYGDDAGRSVRETQRGSSKALKMSHVADDNAPAASAAAVADVEDI